METGHAATHSISAPREIGSAVPKSSADHTCLCGQRAPDLEDTRQLALDLHGHINVMELPVLGEPHRRALQRGLST